MARVNAQQLAEKWGRRLGAASPDIQSGVQRVQTAPGQGAAAAQALMLQKLTSAIQSGQWAAAVSAVSLADWQSAMINKAIPRIQQGIASAQKNKIQRWADLLTAVDASAATARALPKGTIEQSIARATAFMRAMHQNAPKRRATHS